MSRPPLAPPAHPSPYSAADDLRVVRARALRGGNLWARTPVIQAELRLGALAGIALEAAQRELASLATALPSLAPLLAPLPDSDPSRPHGGASTWAHLVARVAAALQRVVSGGDVAGRVVLSDPVANRWTIAVGYDEAEVGLDAVDAAAAMVRAALRGEPIDADGALAELLDRWRRVRPDRSSQAIIDAARARNIPIRRSVDSDSIQLGLGANQRRIRGATTERTSVIAASLADDPVGLHRLLEGLGVPVARAERARSADDAVALATELGYPVRLEDREQPIDEAQRLGDATAVRHAWEHAGVQRLHVVQVVEGRRYELLVVGGRVECAVELDDAGNRRDCLAAVHPQARALSELAAGAVGLDVATVALTTPDIGVPTAKRSSVTGVASPDLVTFCAAGCAAGQAIVDFLYPAGSATTIPIVAVTGTNGKTTTTRLIAHLLRQTGRTVGFTTTDGVYLQEQLLMTGDLTGPFAANVVLSHRDVQAAVLETARGGILKAGLGFASCDVAVVMNVTADHLGLRGIETVEQLAQVKAVLPRAVHEGGWTVLNADDPLVLGMRDDTAGRIALVTVEPPERSDAAERHLASGGVVARVEGTDTDERLVIRDGEEVVELGATATIPLTFGGYARFQRQNLLAASAAAYLLGATPAQLREGLASFRPSTEVTPGRLNLIQTTRGQVLLDYAHNAAAIRGLFEFVRAMPARRRLALLSAPGDRRDEDLREIGRLAAGLDVVIMKEHEVYRRGRTPGAIAEIMADGLRATGFPAERLLTFVEEHDAVDYVMSVMQPGDVVIIIADDTMGVKRQLGPILTE